MDNAAARRVAGAFESLLFAQLLEGLVRGDSALGSFGTTYLAQSIAAHDRSGFAEAFARLLERHRG